MKKGLNSYRYDGSGFLGTSNRPQNNVGNGSGLYIVGIP